MSDSISLILGLLGCTAAGSLLLLVLLCRVKSIRGRASTCIRRITRSDIELMNSSEHLNDKCTALIELCDSIKYNSKGFYEDFELIQHIVQVASSITEETSLMNCRVELLKEMSKSLSSLEAKISLVNK